MNKAKVEAEDYLNFLVATPLSYSCVEAARVQPEEAATAAGHDAFTRFLHRLEPSSDELWAEAQPQVPTRTGVLIIDDTTLDKPYAKQIELVTRHWSGKHHRVVQGINLITLLWSDGDRQIPCDYRLYDKANDGLSKNDHFQEMIRQAQVRDFEPECVLFDGWYSSLENLKLVRANDWTWLTRLKSNRLVTLNRGGQQPLAEVDVSAAGTIVYLKGYGLIKVFKIVAPDGDIEYWATNDLQMDELTRLRLAENAWAIEHYHRGIKQYCGVERAQVRAARAQRNHIGLALRAFLRLEAYCFVQGISWFEAKLNIIRQAVRAYLANPTYTLTSTA